MSTAPLLEAKTLLISYPAPRRWFGPQAPEKFAVQDVSFAIPEGRTLGLVGESGSGKTTIGRAVLKLIPLSSGVLVYRGTRVSSLSEREFRPFRREIQMVFQDPYASVNPRMTVEDILSEPLRLHFPQRSRQENRARCVEMLHRVNLPEAALRRYPHEFSGGQRQRIGIARALAVEPRLLVLDEPVSALDVSVQAQIINLLKDLQAEFNLTYLFIGHDLAVVEYMSDEILVLHHGRNVESGTPEQICHAPQHPYTQTLLAAVPVL